MAALLAGSFPSLKQQVGNSHQSVSGHPPAQPVPLQDIEQLARRLFAGRQGRDKVISRVQGLWSEAAGKDFLVIHSPGGWGNSKWDSLLDWEKSIVTGVTATLEKLGYSAVIVQYFRSGDTWIGHMRDVLKEAQFFFWGRSARAQVMAEELRFIVQRKEGLRIVLTGASQGAAFDNAVMQKLGGLERVYSIELGTFFPHMKRRTVTPRTLAIDSNGLMRDPMCQRDLWAGTRSYIKAFYRWFKYKLQGKPVKFTHCINTPGHEYLWEYPAVHTNIAEFLAAQFGAK